MANRGHLYVIAAPSGAGKTSLMRALLERRPAVSFSVSCTTRAPRPHEQDGRDYHFIEPRRVRAPGRGRRIHRARRRVRQSLRHAPGHGGRGARRGPRPDPRDRLAGRAARCAERLPEAVQIFILPPSRTELEARLRKRGTDSPEAIARRLAESVSEMSHWREFDYVVVNRDFDQALAELEAIFDGRGEASRRDRPGLAELVNQLLRTAGLTG